MASFLEGPGLRDPDPAVAVVAVADDVSDKDAPPKVGNDAPPASADPPALPGEALPMPRPELRDARRPAVAAADEREIIHQDDNWNSTKPPPPGTAPDATGDLAAVSALDAAAEKSPGGAAAPPGVRAGRDARVGVAAATGTYSQCNAQRSNWVGDGYCDRNGGYNTPECNFDDGDCCQETCESSPYSCGQNEYDCKPAGYCNPDNER